MCALKEACDDVASGVSMKDLLILCSAGLPHSSHLTQHGRRQWRAASLHCHQPLLRGAAHQAAGPAQVLVLVSILLSEYWHW